MKLSEVCIRQPVLAVVLSLALVVIGVVGFMRLNLRFFPKLDTPEMSISVSYPGADAKLIETSITTKLENAIASVPNIAAINSTSARSTSSISIHFRLGTDFDRDVNNVRDKVSAERAKLPVAAQPPVIRVGMLGNAVLNLGFIAPNKTPAEIRNYVERYVEPQLLQVKGVGSISIQGASDYAMRIWLNAAKMAALGVTVTDIKNALESNNIDFPAGSVETPARDYTIVAKTQLKTAQQFANIIIKQSDGRTIRFKDIAKVELGNLSLHPTPMRINGKPGINLWIRPLQGASPISVAAALKKKLAQIEKNLPPGMKAKITYNAAIFLKGSIRETFMAIGEAVLLVMIVVFLFLGSLRAALIPIVTIPVCMVSTFGVMYLLGFSINVMSLLAMVLAIGLVVDDAIVMLENIHRHIEQGESPWHAALKGSKEITFPVVAMTLTLAVVYAPIGFAQGFTAAIFKEFAFTLAGAVIISGFVALSLSPMMCSKILTSKVSEGAFVNYLDKLFAKFSAAYQRILQKALHKRIPIIIGLVLIAALGWFIYVMMPSEFIPKEDTGWIDILLVAPTGSSMAYTDKYTRDVEKMVSKIPEVQDYYTLGGAATAQVFLTLKPWGERKFTTQQIVKQLNPKLAKIPGVDAYASVPDPITYGMGGHDFALHVMTIGPYELILAPLKKFVAAFKAYPGLTQVQHDLKFDAQEYALTVNRDLAAVLGVNIQNIATTVSAMLGGAHVTDVNAGLRSYEVLVQMQKQDLKDFVGIKKLYVRGSNNQMVPLSSLIKLSPTIGQPSLSHYNRMRTATITAQLVPGYSVSEAVDYALKIAPKILTPQTQIAFDGKAQQYLEAKGDMGGIFLMALIFIYLVLSAQFGSFIDPFVILLTVPLSIVGALVALLLAGGDINLYSQIGLVTLVGMITKHGILITQFANQLRQKGVQLKDAIVQAATIRLRPILMTTMAMVFGTLPLALATGPGSIGRHQIGWVIVGGLLFGTFFSLIVVPIAYSYLGRLKNVARDQSP